MSRSRTRTLRWGVAAAVGALTVGVLAAPAVSAAPSVSIEVLSGPADAVTGGDALISIAGGRDDFRVVAAGVDVTDRFQPLGDARVGLVEGLPEGVSVLEVSKKNGQVQETLEIENHPITGPVFSGPQHPMYCTASGAPWNLGPTDEDCHVAAPAVSYRYKTSAGRFANYPTDGTVPADLATTTTSAGATVPYVVRVERGTINRAVYETAVLHEPGAAEPTPWTTPAGWNHKLAYTFGGACGVGYWQGSSTGGVEVDMLLSRGYAVASATFNVYAQNCNDVTSAETALMVKEHVVEQLGAPRFTVGYGGSAGTMQQLLLSNNYPGIIDGVFGEIGYPDERTTTVTGHDCRALVDYWASGAGAGWTDAEKLAVTGQAIVNTCNGYGLFVGVDNPARGCAAAIPVEDRWSPTNPDGLRCTIADMMQNVYGVDDQGRALRVAPDNVGVQYGLEALQDGEITTAQFLSLNENVGGMDIDGNRTAERSVASVEAIERAYATGRVNMMTGGLESIPVIDFRPYTDMRGDFHDKMRSAAIRERMIAAHGDAGTHVVWTSPEVRAVSEPARQAAFEQLDEWLENIEAAGGPSDRARTIAARPADLTDGCFAADGAFISETLDYEDEGAQCNQLYPYHSAPRMEAGGSVANDVLKCQVTAPQRDAYPAMTDDEWARLLAAFPEGVCDWSQPSQGFTELEGTWLDFGATERVALSGASIEGRARVGEVLTVEVDAQEGASLAYQWIADGVPIEGATAATFTPTDAQAGSTLTVRVTATLDGLVPTTVVTEPTKKVQSTPDRTRPVVALAAPTTAGPFPAIVLRVDATDDRGLAKIVANIYQAGKLVRSTQTALTGQKAGIHEATVTLPDGSYTIRYNAHDQAGNVSTTANFDVVIDATKPTVTVKTGAKETVGADGVYSLVSFKLHDSGKIDKVTLNGVTKDLSNNAWSDVNFVKPGVFGAVLGTNTLVVYDVAGNTTELVFTLG